ncbi:hypothetical protein [Deinococcus sonorensis]|uniref:Uncharacterized protein n=1 Tax=Deinococcus sonorensis TaxID=309891 RepID=A0ABV8Y8G1_9DEIO
MNDLERQVVQLVLALEAVDDPELGAQLKHLEVVSRRYTGVGAYTDFASGQIERAHPYPSGLRLGGSVIGYVGSQEQEAGFVLYVDDGMVRTLESFVYEGTWPEDAEQTFVLKSDQDEEVGRSSP